MSDLDPRLLSVSFMIGDQIITYANDVAITANGTKFLNATQGDARITIANLKHDVRDYILTEGSPFIRERGHTGSTVSVSVGRESTGLDLLYVGNIYRATISDPPDQTISIQSIQNQAAKGKIIKNNLPGQVLLSTLAQRISDDIGLEGIPVFEATDKQVSDYSYTGGAPQQIKKLEQAGNVDVWIDNDTLYIKDKDKPLNRPPVIISADNGMIGIPKPTASGIQVTMMYDKRILNGATIEILSNRYQALTGQYQVYKLGYNITNRDTPFYLIAEANRLR